MEQLLKTIPSELIVYAREIAFGIPKENYKLVVDELKSIYFHPTCGELCLFKVKLFEGSFIRRPIFISQCYIRCVVCNSKVSVRDHKVCHDCAYIDKNPIEFNYHHKNCDW